jgi:hypothetical protein
MVVQWDIEDFIKSDNKPKIIGILALFLMFYVIFLNYDSSRTFFILIALILLYLIYANGQVETKQQNNDVSSFIDVLEKELPETAPKALLVESTYLLHKPPKNFKHVKTNKDIMNALYGLRFLMTYDKIVLLQVAMLLEYFLKIHFNMILGKYDATTYTEILLDIRHELLNLLHSVFFVIPDISKVFESTALDDDLKTGIYKLQSITYRYVKIVFKKYKNKLLTKDYQGPLNYDKNAENRYDMY